MHTAIISAATVNSTTKAKGIKQKLSGRVRGYVKLLKRYHMHTTICSSSSTITNVIC
jgi:hypothetical protein